MIRTTQLLSIALAALACGPRPPAPEPAPAAVPLAEPLPPEPRPRLAINLEIPKNVVLAGDHVYIATGTQQLYMVDRRAPRLVLVMNQWCNSLASDGDAVFASVETGILRFAAGSKEPAVIATIEAPLSLVVDDSHVYFNRFMKPGLFRVSKTGGKPEQLAAIRRASYLDVDDSHVYFGNYGGRAVQRVLKTGGKLETVVKNAGRPIGVAVDADFVFWGNESSSTINRAAKDGSGITELARGQINHDQLHADDSHVYWRAWRGGAADSVIARVAKDRPLAVDIIAGNLGGASGIALAGDTLFVALRDPGRVVELSKTATE